MVLELIAHCSINLMIHLTFLQVTQLLPKWQDGGGVATMTFFSDGAYHPLAICQRPAASFVQKVSERRTESLTAAGQASCRRPDPEPQMRQSKHQHRRRHRPEYFFCALVKLVRQIGLRRQELSKLNYGQIRNIASKCF